MILLHFSTKSITKLSTQIYVTISLSYGHVHNVLKAARSANKVTPEISTLADTPFVSLASSNPLNPIREANISSSGINIDSVHYLLLKHLRYYLPLLHQRLLELNQIYRQFPHVHMQLIEFIHQCLRQALGRV